MGGSTHTRFELPTTATNACDWPWGDGVSEEWSLIVLLVSCDISDERRPDLWRYSCTGYSEYWIPTDDQSCWSGSAPPPCSSTTQGTWITTAPQPAAWRHWTTGNLFFPWVLNSAFLVIPINHTPEVSANRPTKASRFVCLLSRSGKWELDHIINSLALARDTQLFLSLSRRGWLVFIMHARVYCTEEGKGRRVKTSN